MTLEKVTVGVDGSDGSIAALRWADDLAARCGAALEVVMAWHYPYVTTMPGLIAAVPPAAEMDAATREVLAELVGPVPADRRVDLVAWQGSATGVLLQAAESTDLLVVGSRGHSALSRFVLGSTSMHCATHAPCSVAVVRTETPPLPDDPVVAVAVDGSEDSEYALRWALTEVPAAREVRAILSHDEWVLDDPTIEPGLADRLHREAAAELDRVIEKVGSDTDVARVVPIVVTGDPRTSVLQETAGADLLVMGPRGRGGVAGLFVGSFTTHALAHAPGKVPLVVARRADAGAGDS